MHQGRSLPRRIVIVVFAAVAFAIAVFGASQLVQSAHSALPLGLAVDDPAPQLPSGASWACAQARAGPVRVARDEQMLVFTSLDGKSTADLIWPREFTARLLDGRAELVARDGTVVAREGDVLDDLGGGIGATGNAFHICSVAGKGYDPVP